MLSQTNATIHLKFPAAGADLDGLRRGPISPREVAGRREGGRPGHLSTACREMVMEHGKILVVEDDPMLRMDATLLFEEAGFSVAEFESADDALAYVWDYTEEITAIFTDVEMLGSTSGFDLASIVTSAWPHIAVLVTSGFHEDAPDNLPTRARFIPKPWQPAEVLRFVRGSVVRH